ncbi:helix-turn-helix transcriptional regulator [Vibrio jasicida]|uniref:helix-turn-helix transcriptional regulator n=1 Tax=Vibrio jasicida TaxID=766224 RepID=UPI0005EE2E5C|nr:helix-turn-helix transcriptional regulator [Vibrio jasicida]
MTVSNSIVTVIKERRKALGLSQAQMANIVGMSEKTYSRMESGKTDLKMTQYHSIIRALKTTHLDIALDMLSIYSPKSEDVAAVARLLPEQARMKLVELIVQIYKGQQSAIHGK